MLARPTPAPSSTTQALSNICWLQMMKSHKYRQPDHTCKQQERNYTKSSL